MTKKQLLCWTLVVAVLVHLDWHFGRPHHIRLSLGWTLHWLVGALGGGLLAWQVTRRMREKAVITFFAVTFLGFVLGQIVEPLLEIAYYRDTFAETFTPERGRIFTQFALAFVIAGSAMLAVTRRRRATVQP